ncbi:MAG: hypothetical protein IKD13_04175, partial [Firmicutes bacterium]|nr:hypothetical protein [Bacillota bacterium]
WGAKGHEFESHYSDQKNRRSKTTVFSLSKVPEMLNFLHEKHGKQIEMREKKIYNITTGYTRHKYKSK